MLTGEDIRALRKALNWTYTDLGHYLGISASAVCHWETTPNKHPKWDTMVALNDLREKFKRGEIKPKPANANGKDGKAAGKRERAKV